MPHYEIIEMVGGEYAVLCNGYQWGTDEALFDYQLGCSGQTWPTLAETTAVLATATGG